uniref:Uncharacterized protein n=1 Tax=Vespula pensylvanica TaxID=30213 RepID=A0A834NKD1_VESPE|nr:hypothetical protein H0235_013611 [Vespula pensylvanica]
MAIRINNEVVVGSSVHPDQNFKKSLLVLCAIIIYLLPGVGHQFYQIFMADYLLLSTVRVLQKVMAFLCLLCAYSTTSFSFVTIYQLFTTDFVLQTTVEIKLIMNRLKSDYENFTGEEELEIVEKYTKETKLYVYVVVGFFNLYIISIISPSILNVLLHNFDILDDDQLTLPVPINNVTNGGLLKIRRPFKDIPKYVQNVWVFERPCEKFDWLFQLLETLQSARDTIEYSITIVGSILVLYLNFYVGQKILDQSNAVFEEMCKIPFYMLSIKVQKLLLFMITRSGKPCMLSIGGMFVSSHEVFVAKGMNFFEQHFLFSNRLVQLILGVRPNQNFKKQLFILCAVIIQILPIVGYQFYQIFISDCLLQSTVRILQKVMASLCLLCAYSTTYFSFVTIFQLLETLQSARDTIEYSIIIVGSLLILYLNFYVGQKLANQSNAVFEEMCKIPFYMLSIKVQKLLLFMITRSGKPCMLSIGGMFVASHEVFAGMKCLLYRFKLDCEQSVDKDELKIIEKYGKQTKFYAYTIIVLFSFYVISITFSCILNVILYLFGILKDDQLTLPLFVNNIFQLSIALQNVMKIIEFSIYITGSIFAIYINFYIGQKLLNYSNAVFEELTQVPFYMCSIETQKLLLFMIVRSMKPCMLSIGGLFVSSHEIFAKFYQVYTLDVNLLSIIKILVNIIPSVHFLYCYYILYIRLTEIKLLFVHAKLDYQLAKNENELKIMEKYTKESKLYASLLIVVVNLYFLSIIGSSILKVFMYNFGTSDDIHLTLPFSINSVLYAGWLYYNLFIYQIMIIIIILTIIVTFASLYWVSIQHACGQFSIIILKIHQPFEGDHIHINNVWLHRTFQEEYNWIMDIIKCHIRVTKCNIPFYNLSIKTQKMLLFLLMRCIKPVELSIGDVFVASHTVFAALIQKAFSVAMVYYSILQT